MDQELHHALEKIIKEEKKVLMEALLNKAQKTALSEKEKQTLAQWLKAR